MISLSLLIYAGVLAGVGSVAAVALILLAAFALGDGLWGRINLQTIKSYSGNITVALKTSAGLALLVALVQVAVHWPVNYPAIYIAVIALILVWRRRAIGSLFKGYASQIEWSRDSGNLFALAWSSGLLLFAMSLHVILACKPEVGADALSLHLWIPTYVKTHHFWHFDALQSVASLTPRRRSSPLRWPTSRKAKWPRGF